VERKTPRTSCERTVTGVERVSPDAPCLVRAAVLGLVFACGGVQLGCGARGDEGDARPHKGKGRVHVDVNFANMCPEFESYLVLPSVIDPGYWAEVSVSASDPDGEVAGLTFAWQATSGTFSELALAETKYLCAASGEQMLTAEVRDSAGCTRELPLDVTCLEH
jgi:hypothetical protein